MRREMVRYHHGSDKGSRPKLAMGTKMVKAYVEVRSQHSVGSGRNRFGGPDTYVAVQVVPDNIEKLECLNCKVASKRGIRIIYCGEGYAKNRGPRSMLGKALASAREILDEIEHSQTVDPSEQ